MPVEIAPGTPLQPLTLDQYERMVEVGVLDELVRAGVREYWVVRTAAGVIRVHRDPRDGDYASVEDVTTATFAGADLEIRDLSPPGS